MMRFKGRQTSVQPEFPNTQVVLAVEITAFK